MTHEIPLVERYQGCLVGVAVGDALGQPVEFLLSENEIQKSEEKYGTDKWVTQLRTFLKDFQENHNGKVTEMLPNAFDYWQKGEYTDDTTQTLLLVDSFIETATYDPDDYTKRLVKWYDHGKAKGLGLTTGKSLELIETGTPWQVAGVGTNPSNGSLMRTAPIGLYFRGQPEKIDQAAAEISSITHGHQTAIEVCQMASHFISQLANGYSKSEAIGFVQNNYEIIYKKSLDSIDSKIEFTGGALETFAIALLAFAYSETFEETLLRSVNQGGDSDTYGAVAGAFAGTYWGISQIPQKWYQELNPLTHEQIANKAKTLYEISSI